MRWGRLWGEVRRGAGVRGCGGSGVRRAARDLLTGGGYGILADGIAYPELNGLLATAPGE
ncbi:hypothetical protein GA0115252_100811 [Streptomyces sp. DfronAA-171]|nr:hypothetical protein GA0115252_100811 [Streptomyces sp. DfronAA-171]